MMIVQCHACQTRFRVDESRIQGRGARMRCRRCGEAIIVMKDPSSSLGPPPLKNLFDLRSVLKQPERKPSRIFEESVPTPAEPEVPVPEESPEPREPDVPAAWEADREPPGVESPDEVVSLRVTEEAPREEVPETAGPPFSPPGPEEREPWEVPGTDAATPPEEPSESREPEPPAAWQADREPPGVESPDEVVSLRVTEEAPREEVPETAGTPFSPPGPEEREPREVPGTEAATPPEEPSESREPEPPAAWETDREPPEVESRDEVVSLRVAEEAPREEVPEAAGTPFSPPGPEEREPWEVPGTDAAIPPEEPSEPREPEAPTAWETDREPHGVESHAEVIVDPPQPIPDEQRRLSDGADSLVTGRFSFEEERQAAEDRPFELMLNDAGSLDFLKEEYRRAEAEGDFDISGFLRPAPSPEPEPAETQPPATPQPPPEEEPMPDRLEAIQRELQEIGGGAPETDTIPSPSPAAVPSVPPVRKAPTISPRVAARPGRLRGGRPSLVPLAILFLLIAGGGAYLGFTSGGQEILRRMVPAMESLWLGGESTESRYAVGNLIGYYEPKAKAGTLFVIKGTVTNQGRKKRSGIRVKADLFTSSGEHIASKSVFAGNVLSGDELRSSSMEAIEKEMANRWGDKLSNLDIAPGKSIPFMAVFFDAPAGIEEYRLEARDSE